MSDEYFDANRRLWDAKTGIHVKSDFYDMDRFRETRNSLNAPELKGLGDVSGKSLLHLQCHFGQDTLSWANLGAEVTGVDFSPEGLATARRLSEELGIPARFVESNVLELAENLDGQFDIIFTSYGTIVWLPDLHAWARVINHFLKPGGVFFFVDFHPGLYIWDHDNMKVGYDYFHHEKPKMEEVEGTYADRDSSIQLREYFWAHSIADSLQPLLAEGLILEEFKEYPTSPYNCFANMHPHPDGGFVFGEFPVSTPHLYSLRMRKPES